MNMKQRIAFSALLVAPVVAVSMPTADAASTFTPATSSVYQTIYVDLTKLTGTIEKYSWAIIDGGQKTPIVALNANSFPVKPVHSGKTIEATAHLKDGTTVTSETYIEPFIPTYNGTPQLVTQNGATVKEAYEGLTLQLKVPSVIELNRQPVVQVPEQEVTYTYEWYKVTTTARERIKNSVASYTIPNDFRATLQGVTIGLEVDISATVKNLPGAAPITITASMPLGENPVERLLLSIDELETSPATNFYTYNMAGKTFEQFKEHVTALQLEVNSLPGALKTKITNFNQLQLAASNIGAAETFLSNYQKAVETNDAKDIERAQKSASNLNQRQLSLVKDEYTDVFILKASDEGLDEDAVLEINEELLALYSITDIEELNEQIVTLQEKIDALPRQLHGLIQKEHLTRAQQNSNAVRNFTDKVAMIGEDADTEANTKDIKAAQAAFSTYLKLSYEQAKLISEEDLTFIQEVLEQEQVAALELNEEIEELIANILDTPLTSTEEFVLVQQDYDILNDRYKQLSTKARKFVTNYERLKELRTALKDAARTEALIRQLAAYDPSTNLKSSRSKLQAAQKSALKLSTLEHALLINKEDLVAFTDAVNDAVSDSITSQSELAQSFLTNITRWGVFDDYMSYGTYNSFSEFEAEVSEYNKQFKAIIARERNSLPTKIFLKTATSDIKAVKNAMKKITAAVTEPKPSKQYTRILSAERAYAKLSSTQQNLLTLPYQGGQTLTPYEQLQQKKAEILDLEELNETLSTFKTTGYDRPIEDLQAIVNYYNGLNSGVKQLIIDSDVIKNISKDIKTVRNFHTKLRPIIDNIDNDSTTENHKKALISAYEKLTFTQHSLLQYIEGLEELPAIIEEIRGESSLSSVSDLFAEIAALVENGKYTEAATAENVLALKEAYRQLKPDERRVISNYDILTNAEKHIKKVDALVASKPEDLTTVAGKQWLEKATNLKPLEASLLLLR